FDLPADGNFDVVLRFEVVVAERRTAECANRGEMTAGESLLAGEREKALVRFVPGRENDDVRALGTFGQRAPLHRRARCPMDRVFAVAVTATLRIPAMGGA